MMNYIFAFMIIISFVCSILTGNIYNLSQAVIDSASKALETILAVGGIMCLWTGIMKIAENSGLADRLADFVSPVISLLFREVKSKETKRAIVMNICANFLGMGNAATPFGIKAINLLDKENGGKSRASNAMCMLVVLNTASIQLVPTTLLALMKSNGCNEPFRIIPYVWLCSVFSVALGVISAKAGERKL